MKNYLLLRDNKQSGPHSFEELLSMGLRPYDLIWVDGKSAAWRYPAEFPELKDHAPALPEQPFDRFFRRPATEQVVKPAPPSPGSDDAMEIPTLTRFMQEQEADKQKEIERIGFEFPTQPEEKTPATEKDAPSGDDHPRYVSVSLPAQDAERPILVIGTAETAAASDLPVEAKEVFLHPVEHQSAPGKPVAALFPERDPLAAPRKPAPRSGQPWIQYAAILVGILSFLGLGILIGVKWTREKMQGETGAQSTTLQDDRPVSGPSASESIVVPGGNPDSLALAKEAPVENKAARRQKKDSNLGKPVLSTDIVRSEVTKEMDPAVLQEESRKRREAEDKAKVKGNIIQVVGLQAGKYKVGVFGGISDLDVTVSNGSAYPLDEVVVEVEYLLSNKNVFKTETLRFTDLGPQGSKTLTLPRTGRGVKAESRIVRIDSRELDLAWTRN